MPKHPGKAKKTKNSAKPGKNKFKQAAKEDEARLKNFKFKPASKKNGLKRGK